MPNAVRHNAALTPLIATASATVVAVSAFVSPLLAVGAVGALALALAIIAAPTVATFLFLFLFYVNAPDVLVTIHGLPFAIGAGSVALLGVPVLGRLLRREAVVIPPIVALAVAYIVVSVASALLARSFEAAWAAVTNHLTQGLLLVVLLVSAIRTEATLRAAVWALVLAGGFMGALTLIQESTATYESSYGGFAQITGGGFALTEDALGERVLRPRLAGPIGEQNRYAQVMVVLVPLAIGTFLAERRWFLRLLAGASGFVTFTAVLLTFSRGAAIALLVLALAALALGFVRLRQGMLALVGTAVAIVSVAPDFVARLATVPEVTGALAGGGPAEFSSAIRVTLQFAAIQMFLDHPILGVGAGNFAQLSVDYANPLGIQHLSLPFRAHNLYLEIAAETGLLGVLAFLAMVGYVAIGLARVRNMATDRHLLPTAQMSAALLFALLAYLLSAIFLHMEYERYFWVLLSVCAAGLTVFHKRMRVIRHEPHAVGSRSTHQGA